MEFEDGPSYLELKPSHKPVLDGAFIFLVACICVAAQSCVMRAHADPELRVGAIFSLGIVIIIIAVIRIGKHSRLLVL